MGHCHGSTTRAGTKVELVLGLLRRPEGATMAELVAATSWLPHTTRAALTGLRLVREWNGTVHIVTIGEDSVIRWNDREWKSLSEVASARPARPMC